MNLKTILKISRPRFWLYLAGTYLVGYSFGAENIYSLQNFSFIIHFLFFLIPANIFLYGINDIYDEDTDQFNQKKGTYEHKLQMDEKKYLKIALLLMVFIAIAVTAFQKDTKVQILFILFFALSYFYSSPPLRFKAKPLLDSAFNILYGIPGIIAYVQVTNTLPPLEILIAIFCWTFAMHLFSAIPDIQADKKADLLTTAILFGKRNSLLLCALLWTITSLVTINLTGSFIGFIAIIYPLIPIILIANEKIDLKKTYKIFPFINALVGFILFLYAFA